MWSTWCSVFTTNRTGPCCSGSCRMAIAFVGSCGVPITTTPADVTTKLGLKPRMSVDVKTWGVTRCTGVLPELFRAFPGVLPHIIDSRSVAVNTPGRPLSRARQDGRMAYTAADDRYDSMTYRRCGNSGLDLPAISLGLWHNFGDDVPFERQRAILHRAFDLGV